MTVPMVWVAGTWTSKSAIEDRAVAARRIRKWLHAVIDDAHTRFINAQPCGVTPRGKAGIGSQHDTRRGKQGLVEHMIFGAVAFGTVGRPSLRSRRRMARR